ncbi:Clotting factor B, partial [Stegodyphus mimosarum]
MSKSYWLWKEILCWIFLLNLFLNGVDGRRYDKCFTPDGREGVCVVKRYCRKANNEQLVPCDDDDYCCPIPTTSRSARPPAPTEPEPQPTEIPVRRPSSINRPSHSSTSNDRPPPRRPDVDDRPRKPLTTYDREPQPPKAYDDRIPSYDDLSDNRRFENRQTDTTVSDNRRYDDSVRHSYDDRPKIQSERDRTFSDSYDRNRGRPGDYPREAPSSSRKGDDEENIRRDENRDSEPKRRPLPTSAGHYPAKEHLEPDRVYDPPRRSKPTRSHQKNRTQDSSKAPIKFPDTYELSVPQPKVPACGVKPYELFIAGGQESDEHEWPWMTAIFRRHQGSRPKTFLCGGSLINTKYVLTAAHCFVNNYVILPASSFVVRLGSHYLNSGEEYTVASLVIHHNHSGSDFFNDIALVRLASEVYVTDKIAPICLPFPEMIRENFVGRMATVAGWGDTAFRTSGTRILQHVTVPIVSSEECFAAYSRVRGAAFLARGSDHVICAGLREGGKDACLGDSGGPLMLKSADDRWIVIGIVSLGYKCAEPGYPGVYTRVTHYMSWIQTNMKRY